MSIIDELKTGDILLFTGHKTGILKYLSCLIEYGTHSDYAHIAFILKDPSFIHPSLKGTFVWESSWEGKPDPQDGKIKLGVQITPIHEVLNTFKSCKVILRKVQCSPECFSNKNLKMVHNIVYDKPYDIIIKDWIEAFLQKDSKPQKTDRFWCSALVGYIYTKCGLLNEKTDWSILRPSDFSLSGENLKFINGNKLDNREIRIQ